MTSAASSNTTGQEEERRREGRVRGGEQAGLGSYQAQWMSCGMKTKPCGNFFRRTNDKKRGRREGTQGILGENRRPRKGILACQK